MGGAIEGAQLSWEEAQKAAPIVRKWAIEQLLCLWHQQRDRNDPEPLWGDEIEHTLVDLNKDSSQATLLLDQKRVIQEWESSSPELSNACLQWEWGAYMVESTPDKPYSGKIKDLSAVKKSMRQRREVINKFLARDQHCISLCVFPRLGVPGQFTTPPVPGQDKRIRCQEPRYCIINDNAIDRTDAKTDIPVCRDEKTSSPFHDPNLEDPANAKDNHICIDNINVGPGACSVQTTFQAANEAEARWLHDQLIPMGSVMLALTAATPIWKGYLVETDTRLQRYADIFDDRQPEETTSVPPRWTWNRTYISQEKPDGMENNNLRGPVDETIKQRLVEGGMDESLAVHYASYLWRDPLFLTEAHLQDPKSTDQRLFDILNNGFWPYVRFKIPTKSDGPGWCIEFRIMEAQLNDSDNAAFAVFMYLLSRAITTFHLNFYLPMDKVAESMECAQQRDAVTEHRMWFRREWGPAPRCRCKDTLNCVYAARNANMYGLMTVNEIINGEGRNQGQFPGLISVIRSYLRHVNASPAELAQIEPHLATVSQRASGELPTPAAWMRSFARDHEDYQKDSYVSEKICYDMMSEIVHCSD